MRALAVTFTIALCVNSCIFADPKKPDGPNPPIPKVLEVIPNDPAFAEQWYLMAPSATNPGGMNFTNAWAVTTGSTETVIGIVDQGFDFSHEDFHSSLACPDRFFPVLKPSGGYTGPNRHGTQVMSLIAACSNNDIGMAGGDWMARIQPYEFTYTTTDTASLVKPLREMVTAIYKGSSVSPHIVNFSFESVAPDPDVNILKYPKAFVEMLTNIRLANDEGISIIVASGNQAINANRVFTAGFPGVIAVGAITKERKAAGFSDYGKAVSVLAPGEDILAISEAGDEKPTQGTSFSTPLVAAASALIRTAFLTSEQPKQFNWKILKYFLKKTAIPMTCDAYCSDNYTPAAKFDCQADCCNGQVNTCSAGTVDVNAAVNLAKMGVPPIPLIDASAYAVELPNLGDIGTFLLKNLGGAQGLFQIYNSRPDLISLNRDVFQISPGEDSVDIVELEATVQKRPPARTVVRLSINTLPFDSDDPLSDSVELYLIVG